MTILVEDRKRIHKKPSYRFAVAWIAANDEAGSSDATDREIVAGYVSTLLVADLFGCDPALVAADVVSRRLAGIG